VPRRHEGDPCAAATRKRRRCLLADAFSEVTRRGPHVWRDLCRPDATNDRRGSRGNRARAAAGIVRLQTCRPISRGHSSQRRFHRDCRLADPSSGRSRFASEHRSGVPVAPGARYLARLGGAHRRAPGSIDPSAFCSEPRSNRELCTWTLRCTLLASVRKTFRSSSQPRRDTRLRGVWPGVYMIEQATRSFQVTIDGRAHAVRRSAT
jgi:hypothetical protein